MRPGSILALDVAKRTGIATGVPGLTPALSFIDFGGRDLDTDADVFGRAVMWMARRLRDDPPELIAVEKPLPMYDSALLMGLRGVMLGVANAKKIRIVEASVGEWRKYFLGVGNLKGHIAKQQCIRLCQQLGWALPPGSRGGERDHNAAEAGGLWLWACSQVSARETQRHEPIFLRGISR